MKPFTNEAHYLDQKVTLLAVLRLYMEHEDWHGVSDAANDLRELEVCWLVTRAMQPPTVPTFSGGSHAL